MAKGFGESDSNREPREFLKNSFVGPDNSNLINNFGSPNVPQSAGSRSGFVPVPQNNRQDAPTPVIAPATRRTPRIPVPLSNSPIPPTNLAYPPVPGVSPPPPGPPNPSTPSERPNYCIEVSDPITDIDVVIPTPPARPCCENNCDEPRVELTCENIRGTSASCALYSAGVSVGLIYPFRACVRCRPYPEGNNFNAIIHGDLSRFGLVSNGAISELLSEIIVGTYCRGSSNFPGIGSIINATMDYTRYAHLRRISSCIFRSVEWVCRRIEVTFDSVHVSNIPCSEGFDVALTEDSLLARRGTSVGEMVSGPFYGYRCCSFLPENCETICPDSCDATCDNCSICF